MYTSEDISYSPWPPPLVSFTHVDGDMNTEFSYDGRRGQNVAVTCVTPGGF